MIFGRRLGMLSRMLVCGRFLACLGFLAAVGCTGGTETGNPSITGQLSYTGTSSAPTEIGVRQGGGVASVKNAWLELDQVTVSSSGACGLAGGDTFKVNALGVGDHAAGRHNVTAFEAIPGAFCSLQLPFARVPSDAADAPVDLRGHAIVLAGELADGTPFSIESDLAQVVRLQAAASGFDISRERANTLIAFDFAAWLKDLDLANASREGGRIIVSETSNITLLRAFEAQLASGVALYRDTDGDGVLDVAPELLATAP